MRNEPGLAGKIAREACLRSFMESRDFVRAIQCVEELKLVVAASDNKLEPTTARHLTAFDDLIYVLSKYMCIHQTEIGALDMAQDTLDHVLYPRVELESAGKSKVRGDWFRKDLNLLRDLIAQKFTGDSSTPMGKTSTSNPYSKVNWTREFTAFWEAADMWITRQAQRKASGETSDVHEGPLFARALGEYFYAREHKDPLQPTGIRRGKMRKERRKQRTYTPETPSVVRSISETERETKGAQWGRSQKQNAISPNVPGGVADSSKRNSAKLKRHSMSPIISTGQANSSPTFTVATKARPPTALGNGSPPRPRMTVSSGSESAKSNRRASVDPRDISSADPDRKSHVSHGSVYSFSGDADMPPINPHSFSADFALSSTCGPLLSQIRALDVVDIPETRQIVAATAGNFDRTDKKISIWDVRSGKLLIQLDNGTSKPVTSLVFHPDNPYLLVSSDMEFDVKLWDWRTGVCVRLWRKFHSRIIFKVGIVPGSEDRAATCSSDQSIKVFSLNSTSPATVSSMHANEPFNSFVFSGSADDPSQQKLIASLSYSIRIYRLRTSTLLHTIQLRDLRVNKTPITTLHSHPLHDTYVLLSCDNQLRLVNLITETTVKVYQSRNIPNGVRVEGRFSPCGTWVYCGTWDVRGRGKVRDEVEDSVAGGAGGSGVIVWKAHTGKEEKVDWGTNTPVSVCKW
ncbi:WD40-repeat-containing domain protein [Phlyctochytrium arcticum]|nr:WD40-repeat-containing domain protein [Phlyctochytrium arcticum]